MTEYKRYVDIYGDGVAEYRPKEWPVFIWWRPYSGTIAMEARRKDTRNWLRRILRRPRADKILLLAHDTKKTRLPHGRYLGVEKSLIAVQAAMESLARKVGIPMSDRLVMEQEILKLFPPRPPRRI